MAYNGWTNRATWLVNLWFGDGMEDMREDGKSITAEIIEGIVTDYIYQIVPPNSFVADLIDLNEINWEELAEHRRS